MICSKTKLGSELDRVKQLLIENGYPDGALLSCIKQKLANFAVEKPCGLKKCRFTYNCAGLVMFHQNFKFRKYPQK